MMQNNQRESNYNNQYRGGGGRGRHGNYKNRNNYNQQYNQQISRN